MAQNIIIAGAQYNAVPAITAPKQGGGTARFTDVSDTTAGAADAREGTSLYNASGVKVDGSLHIVTYYTGSSAPASSLGTNGDIYLKTS